MGSAEMIIDEEWRVLYERVDTIERRGELYCEINCDLDDEMKVETYCESNSEVKPNRK